MNQTKMMKPSSALFGSIVLLLLLQCAKSVEMKNDNDSSVSSSYPSSSSLRPSAERFSQSATTEGASCPPNHRVRFAFQCTDGAQLLACPPREQPRVQLRERRWWCRFSLFARFCRVEQEQPQQQLQDDTCADIPQSWALSVCADHGGLEEILPYASGCYPMSQDFWKAFMPDMEIEDDACDYDVPLPALLPGENWDFEVDGDPADSGSFEISEWNRNFLVLDYSVRPRCTNPAFCAYSEEFCYALTGNCAAELTPGETQKNVTNPDGNSLWRSLRLPQVDETCANQILGHPDWQYLKKHDEVPSFCLFVSYRFTLLDLEGDFIDEFRIRTFLNDGDDDFWSVTLTSTVGWQNASIPLPVSPVGEPTLYTLEAKVYNVGDFALDSLGFVDNIHVDFCNE